MPHTHLTSFISMQCMAMLFFSSLPFCHCCAVAVHLPFHGYAWCMPLTHAATCLVYVGTHWLDPIYTCTYIPGSLKGHKCQPENSSLVPLVFPHYQWDHLQNRLLAPMVCPPLLQFPRVSSWRWYLWVASLTSKFAAPDFWTSWQWCWSNLDSNVVSASDTSMLWAVECLWVPIFLYCLL